MALPWSVTNFETLLKAKIGEDLVVETVALRGVNCSSRVANELLALLTSLMKNNSLTELELNNFYPNIASLSKDVLVKLAVKSHCLTRLSVTNMTDLPTAAREALAILVMLICTGCPPLSTLNLAAFSREKDP